MPEDRLSEAVLSGDGGEPFPRETTDSIDGRRDGYDPSLVLETILARSPLNITVYDSDFTVRDASHAAARLVGLSREELRGLSLREYLPSVYLEDVSRSLAGEIVEGEGRVPFDLCPEETWTRVLLLPVRDSVDEVRGGVVIVADISEAKRAGQLAEKLAFFDPLTQLPNRIMATTTLDRVLNGAKAGRRKLTVIWLNLDHFKRVNDALGQAAGDRLLIAVAERLSAALRANDLLARVAADDFLLVLPRISSREHLERLIDGVQACFARPFMLDAGATVYVTASCGVAIRQRNGGDARELQERAHTAMRNAKQQGGDCCRVFEENGSDESSEKIRLAAEIREGVRRGEFTLHYQPQIEVSSGRVVGVEALARWRHPKRGLLAPAAFIPFAEESGLIVELGRALVEEACRQLRDWKAVSAWVPRLAFNVSAREFQRTNVCEQIVSIAAESAISTSMLEVEITETAVLADPARAAQVAEALRSAGLTVTLDDFGTGYSSLTHLREFPIDRVKIDRSFIAHCLTDASAGAIAEQVTALAHRLGLSVVAEGVETAEQLDFVRAAGCDIAQGYHFSRPLPQQECLAYLRRSVETPRR